MTETKHFEVTWTELHSVFVDARDEGKAEENRCIFCKELAEDCECPRKYCPPVSYRCRECKRSFWIPRKREEMNVG